MPEKILVADNNRIDSWFFQHYLSQKGHAVETTVLPHLFATLKVSTPDLIILSFHFLRLHGPQAVLKLREASDKALIILLVSHHEIAQARLARKFGIFDYIFRPYSMEEIESLLKRAAEVLRVKKHATGSVEQKTDRFGFHHVVGRSPAFTRVIELARKVAKSDTSTVLLQGESGTGKDVLAKAIHFESARYRKPFVEITCSALPEALLESELFGHERGSFTDAKGRKEGLFLLADSGTAFLNEIGDMSLPLQAKVLRLIEQRTFRMVGGTKDVVVDVRILAATCVDLKQAVDRGAFRLDLYYRLNVIPITLPPLRDHKEDIMPLAHHFLEEYNRKFQRTVQGFSPEARARLERYHWPGNVRELRNVIERILILENADLIGVEHLPAELCEGLPQPAAARREDVMPEQGIPLLAAEEQLIRQTLAQCNYNLSKTARMLHIGRDALRYRLKKLGIAQEQHT
ncbi:MAG: sigma 54-interacting transcriptional regulator [Candidatus Binatia bacterium]